MPPGVIIAQPPVVQPPPPVVVLSVVPLEVLVTLLPPMASPANAFRAKFKCITTPCVSQACNAIHASSMCNLTSDAVD